MEILGYDATSSVESKLSGLFQLRGSDRRGKRYESGLRQSSSNGSIRKLLITGEHEMAWSERILDPRFWRRISVGKSVTPPSVIGDLVEMIELTLPARVLDIGCGHGYHAAEFASRGFTTTGVDLTPEFVEEAQATFPDVAFTCADARDFVAALPSESEDLILFMATSVFGYFPTVSDDLSLLRSTRTALRFGGRIVIDQPNHLRLRKTEPARFPLVEGLTLVRRYELEGHDLTTYFDWIEDCSQAVVSTESVTVRLYNSVEIRQLLSEAGFSKVDLYSDFTGESFHEDIPSRLIAIAAK